MNPKIPLYARTLFWCLMILGIGYVSFLAISVTKVIPGVLMQSIFLIDAFMRGTSEVSSLVATEAFMGTAVWGVLLGILVWRFLSGLLRTIGQIFNTQRLVQNTTIANKARGVLLVHSDQDLVFTAGLITPRVYMSSQLYSKLSSEERRAVILHERSHQRDGDPLRGLLVQFLHRVLPPFPYKNYVYTLYTTLVELKCDAEALAELGHKRPLLSALQRMIHRFGLPASPSLAIQGFNNSPERIPVLLGIQEIQYRAANLLVVVLLLAGVLIPVTAAQYSFYRCEHIQECFALLRNDFNQNSDGGLCAMHSTEDPTSCLAR